jgi:hypothetical protein
MKRTRRYAARTVLFVLLVAASPFGMLHAFFDWMLDRFDPYIESLEAIANDD